MTRGQLARLRALIDAGQEDRFYSWPEWKALSHRVRERVDHNECQRCKSRGKVGPADLVHHIKHLRDRPDLALSIYDPDTKERQLVTLCRACHELEHPERLRPTASAAALPLTVERWD